MDQHIRVLIVEDVAEDAELIERALKRDGLKFLSKRVFSEETFREEMQQFNPDVVLSDYNMPQFDGLSVIKMAKAISANLPVIIITGTMSDVKAANLIKAGADDYILKDRLARLSPAIQNVLAKKEESEEKQKLARSLEESEIRLRSLFERMLDGFAVHELIIDTNGKPVDYVFIQINDAFERITGLKRSDIIGKRATEIMPGILESSLDWLGTYGEVVLEGKDVNFEQYSNDFKKWLYVSAYRTGERQFTTISEDITKRKIAERSLQHRMDMEVLISSISANIINSLSSDVDAGINSALEKVGKAVNADRSYVFRFSKNGLETSNTHEWCAPGIEPQIDKLRQLAVDRFPWWMEHLKRFESINIANVQDMPEEANEEKEILKSQNIQSLIVVPMIHAGNLIGFLGFDSVRHPRIWPESDITLLKVAGGILGNALEYKDSEKRLKESEERFFKAFDASPSIMTINKFSDGRYVAVNETFLEILDFAKEEVLGMRANELGLWVNQRDRLRIRKDILEEQIPVKDYEMQFRTKNGDIRTGLASAEIILIGDEKLVLSVITDITERKQMENMLIQSEKMAAIGTLAAGIAHEINNPLGYIDSNLGMIANYGNKIEKYCRAMEDLSRKEQNCSDLLELKSKHNVNYVLQEIQNAAHESIDGVETIKRIVSGLRDFSRIEKSETKLADINNGIEKALNIVWNELKYNSEVVKEYGDIPEIECDINRLIQVFMNIFINAAQAIEKRGKIVIKTFIMRSNIVIQISDTGKGIPKEQLGKIFDAFFTTKAPGKGTGLGLSISYKIVQEHRGAIFVKSEPGIGTEFTIKLPIRKVLAEKTARILVVDDEESVREILIQQIKNYDPSIECEQASSGFDVADLLHSFKPNIVFLDVNMPGIDGLEVCKRIMQGSLGYEIKVVIITGLMIEELYDKALDAGASLFLKKPITSEKLYEILAKLIGADSAQ